MTEKLIEASDQLKRPSRGFAKYTRRIKAQERRGLLIGSEVVEVVNTNTRASLINEQAQARIKKADAKRLRRAEMDHYYFVNKIGLDFESD